ncbi:hypothetical protein ACFYTQ_02120 [Nocardia sp. NPDC004068]|uniref:hypothetical protein n=1 Tax=Nocardia sp. NPDC004068 TaxID=3364303 RepID=UPI0036A409C1
MKILKAWTPRRAGIFWHISPDHSSVRGTVKVSNFQVLGQYLGDMDAENRLEALGVPLEETDFGREDEPDIGGCLLVRQVDGGLMMKVAIRPGIAGEERDMFAQWAESRLLRFAEHGPEPDGWQHRSDGDWQLWGRWQQMPGLD